jgi:hypothetical protein
MQNRLAEAQSIAYSACDAILYAPGVSLAAAAAGLLTKTLMPRRVRICDQGGG